MKTKTDSDQTPTAAPPSTPPSGLYVTGRLQGRSRRLFQREGKPNRYIITLAVVTDDAVHRITRWSDSPEPADLPQRGDFCSLKVLITPYTRSNGEVGYRLTWGTDGDVEEF